MRTTTARTVIPAIATLLVIGAIGAFLAVRMQETEPRNQPSTTTKPLETDLGSRAIEPESPSARTPVTDEASMVALHGFVVSRVEHRPLLAMVRCGSWVVATEAQTGRFECRMPRALVAGLELVVSAPGYSEVTQAVTHDPLSGDLGTILLEPLRTVRVRTLDSTGAPFPRTRVLGLPSDSPECDSEILLTVTGDDGIGRFDPNGIAALRAMNGQVCSRWTEPASDEDELVLVLSPASAGSLAIRDGSSGSGVGHVRLRIHALDVASRTTHAIRTDDSGLASVVLPVGNYAIESATAGLELIDPRTVPRSEAFPSTPGVLVHIEPGGPTWIDARRSPVLRLHVVDATTTAGVALVHYAIGVRRDHEAGWRYGASHVSIGDGGLHEIVRPRSLDGMHTNLAVWSETHAPTLIGAPVDESGELEVRLQPARGIRLRVLMNGTPLTRGTLGVVELHSGRTLFLGALNAEGLSSEFASGRDALAVHLGDPFASSPITVIDARQSIDDTIELEIARWVGSIVVRGSNAVNTIACVDELGEVTRGLGISDRVHFAPLRPGRYEVGPIDQVRTAQFRRARGFPSLPLTVQAGRETVIDAPTSWLPTEVARGRIECTGVDPGILVAIPLFDDWGTPIPGGRPVHSVPIGPDGEFVFRNLSCVPRRVAVAVHETHGNVRILTVIPFQDRSRIECGSIELDLRTVDPARTCHVEFDASQPDAELIAGQSIHVPDDSGRVVISPVVCGLRELQVIGLKSPRTLSVAVRPGECTRLVLSP